MTPKDKAVHAREWWRALRPNSSGGGDPATLAKLRRAATLLDAAEEEATVRLAQQLGGRGELEGAALCAAVLAWVRENDTEPVARRVGRNGKKQALMSPLRFRRLIQAGTAEDRLIQFRRLVMLADRKVNVVGLAAALVDWSDEHRRDWIFDYYNFVPSASDIAQQSTEGTPR